MSMTNPINRIWSFRVIVPTVIQKGDHHRNARRDGRDGLKAFLPGTRSVLDN